MKGRGLTKVRCSALIVKGSVILQKSAKQTRRNVKEMKPRLQDKSLMRRTHSWSCSHRENEEATGCGTTTIVLEML